MAAQPSDEGEKNGKKQPQHRIQIGATREENRHHVRSAGADHLVLRTDRDWVGDLIRHVVLRRTGQTTGRKP